MKNNYWNISYKKHVWPIAILCSSSKGPGKGSGVGGKDEKWQGEGESGDKVVSPNLRVLNDEA